MSSWMDVVPQTVSAALVGACGTYLAARVAAKIQSGAAAAAKADEIAARGLSDQFQGWGTLTDHLQEWITAQEQRISKLESENRELLRHKAELDKALYECERKNEALVARVTALEARLNARD